MAGQAFSQLCYSSCWWYHIACAQGFLGCPRDPEEEQSKCPMPCDTLGEGGWIPATFTAFNPFLLGALSSGLKLSFDKERHKGGGNKNPAHCK